MPSRMRDAGCKMRDAADTKKRSAKVSGCRSVSRLPPPYLLMMRANGAAIGAHHFGDRQRKQRLQHAQPVIADVEFFAAHDTQFAQRHARDLRHAPQFVQVLARATHHDTTLRLAPQKPSPIADRAWLRLRAAVQLKRQFRRRYNFRPKPPPNRRRYNRAPI